MLHKSELFERISSQIRRAFFRHFISILLVVLLPLFPLGFGVFLLTLRLSPSSTSSSRCLLGLLSSSCSMMLLGYSRMLLLALLPLPHGCIVLLPLCAPVGLRVIPSGLLLVVVMALLMVRIGVMTPPSVDIFIDLSNGTVHVTTVTGYRQSARWRVTIRIRIWRNLDAAACSGLDPFDGNPLLTNHQPNLVIRDDVVAVSKGLEFGESSLP